MSKDEAFQKDEIRFWVSKEIRPDDYYNFYSY